MIQSSAPRLPKIRSKADLQVQPMKFCFVRIAAIERLDDYVVAANVRFDGLHRSMTVF
jgi:hypothetical protein